MVQRVFELFFQRMGQCSTKSKGARMRSARSSLNDSEGYQVFYNFQGV
jgi:hypothetical protein